MYRGFLSGFMKVFFYFTSSEIQFFFWSLLREILITMCLYVIICSCISTKKIIHISHAAAVMPLVQREAIKTFLHFTTTAASHKGQDEAGTASYRRNIVRMSKWCHLGARGNSSSTDPVNQENAVSKYYSLK